MTFSPDDTSAADLITRLGLAPHPEGGWFRETWRSAPDASGRAGATAIHFLLEAHDRSHWHRIDADELWLWHAGVPLSLSIAVNDRGPVEELTLGPDVCAGHQPQALVPAHAWQAAQPDGGWTLVSCVVSPGFEFSGFELAPDNWRPG